MPAHFVGCRGRAAAWFGHCGHTAAQLAARRVREGARGTVGTIDSAHVQQKGQRVFRNPLLLSGRLILERRGASADLQGEADFCRSTRSFFKSCSSTHVRTSSSPASSCRRRQIVANSIPPTAYVVRRGPEHSFSPSVPRISRAPPLHASREQVMHPCTPLAPPSIILTPSHLPRARPSAVAP